MAPTMAVTQASTAVSAATVSSRVMQSLSFLFSSFSKQPLLRSSPPSNLSLTFGAQVGSAVLPGVSAVCSHLSNPAAFGDMHLVLPPRHFFCSAEAAPHQTSASVSDATVTIERDVEGLSEG